MLLTGALVVKILLEPWGMLLEVWVDARLVAGEELVAEELLLDVEELWLDVLLVDEEVARTDVELDFIVLDV